MSQPGNAPHNSRLSWGDGTQIRAPGSIQSHGMLLVLAEPELTILQLSKNTQQYLGLSQRQLLGQSLISLLAPADLSRLQTLRAQTLDRIHYLRLNFKVQSEYRCFHGSIHRTDQALIVELEPCESEPEDTALSLYSLANGAIARLGNAATLSELLDTISHEIRQLTGFDRVHIYQFDVQEAGEVIAEAKQPQLSSLKGLHFPQGDIPEPSRSLYKRGLMRYIPDIQQQPVPLTPSRHPGDRLPLDLGKALLRSVDPCCVQYYQNMGSQAALIFSILQDGQLWGLVSCHHCTPKIVPFSIRSVCELLVQLAATEIKSKVHKKDLKQQEKLQTINSELIQSIAKADNFLNALVTPEERLLQLVDATGAAVSLGDEIHLVGLTPTLYQVQELIEWANQAIEADLYQTQCLSVEYPDAAGFKASASGLLLLRISRLKQYLILWFRPEVLQTINWGGYPHDAFQTNAAGGIRLSPRHSFELWQETVQATSLPWRSFEAQGALDLRNAIVGLVLTKADELEKINLELRRRNEELAAFAYASSHDLKEPLRGIYNYASILLEDYESHLDEEGRDYLNGILEMSQRMEMLINGLLRIAQLRQAELHLNPVNLNQCLQQASDVIRASYPDVNLELLVPEKLPTLVCDPVMIGEVFRNLISNGIKYNKSEHIQVEVGCICPTNLQQNSDSQQKQSARQPPIFYVRDNGIGIKENHIQSIFTLFKRLHPQDRFGGGVGAGLAIVKQIIERHNGSIWVESIFGEGSTFFFTLN